MEKSAIDPAENSKKLVAGHAVFYEYIYVGLGG
jgi:hypothetical protein